MRVYCYHTQNVQYIMRKMEKGEFPSHFLYGGTKLKNHGIDVIWHKSLVSTSRLRQMMHSVWQMMFVNRRYDAIYATHYQGLEPLIFLRALGLFRKRIVIWHHQPIVVARSWWRNLLGKLFYRGIDDMFFFSQKLINDSIQTHKADPSKFHLGHWGADLELYDRVIAEKCERKGFVSTGKEKRDMTTLVAAFNETGAPLKIFLNTKNGSFNYKQLFDSIAVKENIHVEFPDKLMPYELSKEVNKAQCVVICCKETSYTVGLTTVVEALAMGMPMICSHNPQIPVDIDKEKCGISVPYGDVEGWKKAIEYIQEHPEEAEEMGHRGRKLAETTYNDAICAAEVAQVLLGCHTCKPVRN